MIVTRPVHGPRGLRPALAGVQQHPAFCKEHSGSIRRIFGRFWAIPAACLRLPVRKRTQNRCATQAGAVYPILLPHSQLDFTLLMNESATA